MINVLCSLIHSAFIIPSFTVQEMRTRVDEQLAISQEEGDEDNVALMLKNRNLITDLQHVQEEGSHTVVSQTPETEDKPTRVISLRSPSQKQQQQQQVHFN